MLGTKYSPFHNSLVFSSVRTLENVRDYEIGCTYVNIARGNSLGPNNKFLLSLHSTCIVKV